MKKLSLLGVIGILCIFNIHIPIALLSVKESIFNMNPIIWNSDSPLLILKGLFILLKNFFDIFSVVGLTILTSAVCIYAGVFMYVYRFNKTTDALYIFSLFYRCVPRQSQNILLRQYIGEKYFLIVNALLSTCVYQIVMVKNMTDRRKDVRETVETINEYKQGIGHIYSYLISSVILGEMIGWILYGCIEYYDTISVYAMDLNSISPAQKRNAYFLQITLSAGLLLLEYTNYRARVTNMFRFIGNGLVYLYDAIPVTEDRHPVVFCIY